MSHHASDFENGFKSEIFIYSKFIDFISDSDFKENTEFYQTLFSYQDDFINHYNNLCRLRTNIN